MAWLYLFSAGILEVVWAFTMKQSDGFTRPMPTAITIVAMIASFAVVVLAISAVSIPLMLERHVTLGQAIQVSLCVVRDNPVTMAAWGLIVAVLLALGSLPLFIGLAVVVPVLGHATWHLYRRAVAG